MFTAIFLVILLILGIPLGVVVISLGLMLAAERGTGFLGLVVGLVIAIGYIALWAWGATAVIYRIIDLYQAGV